MPHSLKSFNGFISIVGLFQKARIKKLMSELTKKLQFFTLYTSYEKNIAWIV